MSNQSKTVNVGNLKSGDVLAADLIVDGKVFIEKGRIFDKVIIDQLKEKNVKVVRIVGEGQDNYRLFKLSSVKSGMTAVGPLNDANGNTIFNETVRKVLTGEDLSNFDKRGVKSVRIVRNKASEILFQTYENLENKSEQDIKNRHQRLSEKSQETIKDVEFFEDNILRTEIFKASKLIESSLRETISYETTKEVRDNNIRKIIELFERDDEALILLNSLQNTSYKEALSNGKELCDLAIKFGRFLKMNFDQLVELGYSAYLCDIGMIELNSKIQSLNKKSLIINEVHKHPVVSSEKATGLGFSFQVSRAIREHHEREDGSGYPYGIEDHKICLNSKIIAILDSYISMIKTTGFKNKQISPPQALRELIFLGKAHIYNKGLVDKFFKMMTMYPVSTLVELSSGEIGVVTQTRQDLKFIPKVTIFTNENGDITDSPKKVDLSKDKLRIKSEVTEDKIKIKKEQIFDILVDE